MRTAECPGGAPRGIATFDERGIPSATTKLANDAKLKPFAKAPSSSYSSAVEAIDKVLSPPRLFGVS